MTKYISTGSNVRSNKVYHTNKDCGCLKGTVREVTKNELKHHELRLCQWCDPDKTPNAQYEQDRSYQAALKEAAKDD